MKMQDRERHFYGLVKSDNLPPIIAIEWSSNTLPQDLMVKFLTDGFACVYDIMQEIIKIRNIPSHNRLIGLEQARKKLWEFGWCPKVAN